MKPIQIHPGSALVGAALVGVVLYLSSMFQSANAYIPPSNRDALGELLEHLHIVQLPDGAGGFKKTFRFTGVNVQIVNGRGATNGYRTDPDATSSGLEVANGLGNLIVGYNEPGNPLGDDRTGSHNLVVGHGHSFSSFGGVVFGRDNAVTEPYAGVAGGEGNLADGAFSSIGGGSNRTVSGANMGGVLDHDWVGGSLWEDL